MDRKISLSTADTSVRDAKTLPLRSRFRKTRWFARALLLLLLLFNLWLTFFPTGRSALRAALVLPALLTNSDPLPLQITGSPVKFERSQTTSAIGPVYLDIYEPADPPPAISSKRAALINIVGVGDNRADPQLINLSRSLAHEGFVVVNMGTPALFSFRLTPDDRESVIQTVSWLSHRADIDPKRIGIIGFSAGGALACLAAADLRMQNHLNFITLFGSYFDASTLLHEMGRRSLNIDGHAQPWHPTYVPTQVLANTLNTSLSVQENNLFQQAFKQNGNPLTDAEQRQLSPQAAAIYHLLEGDQPDQTDQNFAKLSPQVKEQLTALSPSQILSKITAHLYILHDRNDQYLPYSQSRQLAAEIQRMRRPYDFAEFGIFQHVEVRPDLGFGQIADDASHLYRLLTEMLAIAS